MKLQTSSAQNDQLLTAPAVPATVAELPTPLNALVARISDPDEARATSEAFLVLSRLLREIEGLDVEAANAPAGGEADAVLRSIGRAALGLVERIEADAFVASADGELAGVMNGVGFAIRHELRSAFGDDMNSPAPCIASEPDKAAHTHGLLRNCFQQCILLIARVIDPELDETELFEDGRVRLQQTLLLRDALASLIRSVGEAERKHYPQSAVALVEEVEKFRRESLGYLMRKDWATFETLAAEVASTRDHAAFRKASRRFLTYVETLLGHVQMRAVLAQHDPAPAHRHPLMRVFETPAAWTAAAACALVAIVLFVAPGLKAKERREGQTATIPRVSVEEAAPATPSAETAPAVAERAESPRAAATRRVIIQLGAYGNEAMAAAQAARLRESGVEAFVARGQAAGGGFVFRVQTGPFESRAEAALAGKRLQERGAVRNFVVTERG